MKKLGFGEEKEKDLLGVILEFGAGKGKLKWRARI